jgi:hypothetical protein
LPSRELVEFVVEQRDAQLHDTVRSYAAPPHMLTLAHSSADDPINRRFDEASRDPPPHVLPCSIVDQRLNIALEIVDHIEEGIECSSDLNAHRLVSLFTKIKQMG